MIQVVYLIFFGVVNFLVYYLFVRDFIIAKKFLFSLIGFSVLFIFIQNYYLFNFGIPNDLFFSNLKEPIVSIVFFSISGLILELRLQNDRSESNSSHIYSILFHSIKFFRTRIIFL